MSDDVWWPSDSWVEGFIRRALGMPSTEPVPPALVVEWRNALVAQARRARRAGAEGRDPWPPRRHRDPGGGGRREGPNDLLLELLQEEWAQVAIQALLAMPGMLAAVAATPPRAQVLRGDPRHEAAPAQRYMVSKLGGTPWRARWGRPAYLSLHDGTGFRLPRQVHPRPEHMAAVNGATVARARGWLGRLETGTPSAVRAVMAELDQVGPQAIAAAAPLDITQPEPGPPRGLLADELVPEDREREPAPAGDGMVSSPGLRPGTRA